MVTYSLTQQIQGAMQVQTKKLELLLHIYAQVYIAQINK
jgi:hypothetical protein